MGTWAVMAIENKENKELEIQLGFSAELPPWCTWRQHALSQTHWEGKNQGKLKARKLIVPEFSPSRGILMWCFYPSSSENPCMMLKG